MPTTYSTQLRYLVSARSILLIDVRCESICCVPYGACLSTGGRGRHRGGSVGGARGIAQSKGIDWRRLIYLSRLEVGASSMILGVQC